ncbi:aldehyde ferredoxin oxidoreductase family protein [Stetteria hydrogenophila]
MKGYNFKLLRVNLSTGRWRVEEIPEEDLRLFIGGKGLGTLILYREVPPGTDPLSPGNKLVFAAGPFNGLVPGASKVAVVSKSPLTRLINDSYAGDFFANKLRAAGFDALVVEGASRDPVYLWIHDGEVEVRDAGRLWGLRVPDTVEAVRRETDSGASVAAIGPAGERLVRIANITFDGERAAGRGGLGAVMGSKKLKAVAVQGTGRVEAAEPERLREKAKALYDYMSTSPRYADTRRYGTTNGLLVSASLSMSPSYNFKRPYIPEELAARLAGEAIKAVEVEPGPFIHPPRCPLKCARYVEAEHGGRRFRVKPEYENLAMLGAAVGVFDRDAVLYFNRLANDLGLDSISAGNAIAWAMELAEQGILTRDEYPDAPRGFGDAEAVERLLHNIAYRRGLGAILAEGVRRASQALGRGAEAAVEVKGLEAPAWDPRGRRAYGLSYATADIGASHLRGWPHPHEAPSEGPARERVASLAEDRDREAVFDSLVQCKFVSYSMDDIVELFNAVTGLGYSKEDLYAAARRTEALARIHGVLDWVTPPLDDTVPPRWMEPIPDGPLKGVRAFLDWRDFEEARREYYRLRGWHEEYGVPLPETVEELGIHWARGDAERALRAVEARMAWRGG